jgi:hypothetical protein
MEKLLLEQRRINFDFRIKCLLNIDRSDVRIHLYAVVDVDGPKGVSIPDDVHFPHHGLGQLEEVAAEDLENVRNNVFT